MAKTDTVRTRKRRKRGNLGQLRGVLWMSLLELEKLISGSDPETRIKAANALAALSRSYLACLEVVDIETRLVALEQMAEQDPTQ